MDSTDEYIARLSDPAVQSYNRREFDEDNPLPSKPNVTEDHISAAEEALGVALPPSYRRLVKTVHPVDAPVCWVWDNETDTLGEEIVSVNRGPYASFPAFLIVLTGDDSGNAYGFDTRHPDGRGEYPIVFFDHEIHDEDSTDFEMVAKDLGEFLLGLLPHDPPAT
jgi:cell wall assembly regulator SMI1